MKITFGNVTMSAPLEKYLIKSLLQSNNGVNPTVSKVPTTSPNSNDFLWKAPLNYINYMKGFLKQMDRFTKTN